MILKYKKGVREETYMKKLFKNDKKLKLVTKPRNAGSTKKCCLFEKQPSNEGYVTKNSNALGDKTVVKHCQLTGRVRRMAHIECILKTRKLTFHPYQHFSTTLLDTIVI